MRKFSLVCMFFYCIAPTIIAQNTLYFKGKYAFPVKPDNLNELRLTGNMGEIRPNHFHGGLDVADKTGESIYSIYEGYISRIKTSTFGYGNVIYITHPETSHVSVYAHLSDFSPKIRNYIRQKQYEQEQFEIEIFPSPTELPIETKQLIGYMGNTGNSFGAHLHFEIRDIADFVLNPEYFYDLRKDALPPKLFQIAVSPLSPQSHVAGKYQTLRLKPISTPTGWQIPQIVEALGLIGLEGVTWDVAQGISSSFATSKVRLRVNQTEIFSYKIDAFPMYEIYGMNLHINYKLLQQTGATFQRFYCVDGNRLGIYQGNGKIEIEDGKTYQVEIDLEDVQGNFKTLQMTLQGKLPPQNRSSKLIEAGLHAIEINENTLIVRAKYLKTQEGNIEILTEKGENIIVPLAYLDKKEGIFLYDLRLGTPKEIKSKNVNTPFRKIKIPSGTDFTYKHPLINVFFPNGALADTSYLSFTPKSSYVYIGEGSEPLVWDTHITCFHQKNNITDLSKLFVKSSQSKENIENINDSTYSFRTGYLGNLAMLRDYTPPIIHMVRKTSEQLFFSIGDSGSGIAYFKAYLNGKFVLMEYEHKNALIWTDPSLTEPFLGEFELYVYDKVGNVRVFKKSF